MLVLAFDIGRVAFIESHWDEDACISISWLLSKGWRLYGDVFSHHMPLDYIPGWAIASLFGNRFEVFRGFMIFLWAAACSGLFFSLRRHESESARLVPFLFAVLSSQWLTYWMGQMMLVESYWGYAIILLLATIGGPIGLPSRRVHGGAAVLVGFLMGLLLSASLTCVLPFACLAAWMRGDGDWRGAWKGLLGGFAAWSGLFFLWCLAHVDLAQWYRQAVGFNVDVYARFQHFELANPFLGLILKAFKETAAYFLAAGYGSPLERYFEGILKAGLLGWIGWNLVNRRFFAALWWLIFIVSIKARSERFIYTAPLHSTPFFLVAVLVLSVEMAGIWSFIRRRNGLRVSLAAAFAGAVLLAPTLIATSLATASLKEYAGNNPRHERLLAAIRKCTASSDRLAAFPFYSRVYFDSERLPAIPNVFYLPWQAAWPPQHSGTLGGLERSRPKVVIIQDTSIWGIPWSQYGHDVEAWVRNRYVPIILDLASGGGAGVQLYVLKDEAAEFVRCAEEK